MKTPKEKAIELVNKFRTYADDNYADDTNPYHGQILANKRIVLHNSSKQCALIAVDEIINEYSNLPHFGELYLENIEYLEVVKQEIKKL